MKILKLYLFILAGLLLLDVCLPHNEAWAWFPRGIQTSVNQSGANACGTSNNNWCVDTDGWTRFSTVKNSSGTCAAGTSDTNCIVAADNSTYASFNGTITGTNTLTINSGTPPLNGQSLLLNGSVIGRITAGSGSGPFTLAGSPANQTSDFTSSPGNDTTCRLEDPPVSTFTGSISGDVLTVSSGLTGTVSVGAAVAGTGLIPNTVILAYGTGGTTGSGSTGTYKLSASQTGATPTGTAYTSLQLSSYSPSLPCFSQSTTYGKLRLTNPKTFTATITATISGTLMQVTATNATIYVGAVLSGGTVVANTSVVSQVSGAAGGTGFYTVNKTQSTTATQAQLSRITATRDWMITKKGTTWNGMIAGGNFNANGWSPVDLTLVATYGTGARPKFSVIDGANNNCFFAQGGRGYQMAITGYWCVNPMQDPASAGYATYTINADVGATLCAGATTICNTTVPAAVQSNPTRYRAFGTGISANAVTAATATTVTLTSSAGNATTVGTGKINIQLTNTTGNNGMGWNEFDTLIVEDNRIEYGSLGPQNTFAVATDVPFARIRRNILLNQYTADNFGGDNIFAGYTNIGGGYILLEENVFVAGGWIPATWGAYGDVRSHNMYLHNPSVPVNLYSNVVGFNSADNQYRDGGTSYNNTFFYNGSGGSLVTATQDNPTTMSYDVHMHAYNVPVGTRTAAVTACSGTGSGCTTLKLDGAISQTVGGNNAIANLSNPNSLGNGTACNLSSVADAATVNLGCTITAGNRGDGVQAGDIIRIYQNGGLGVQFNALGQFVSNQPTRGTGSFLPYAAMTNVSVSAASPSVVTDTGFRSAGEPFSFSPVIITAFGSGYGANATGTLTWAGAGCSVNPVINVSTDASGRVAKFNSITTPGTCSTPPAYNGNAWVAGGGLSAGSNATLMYHLNDGTLPTGVSYANNTGSCTGTVVTNPTTGVGICTYYALANGTSYQFSATSGGAAINASGSNGSSIQRTGSTLFNFDTAVAPIYVAGVPAGVSAGTSAYIDSNAVGFPGANGGTLVQSLSADRYTLITEDPLITTIQGRDQYTMLFGLPAPCSIYPSCYTATVGPNNMFLHSEVINGSYGAAVQFNRVNSGFSATGNYILNWNSNTTNNMVDNGFVGANTQTAVLNSGTPTSGGNWSATSNPKASIEYYDASQLEAGNTFSGYIDNGAGGAGYILTITSGSPSLAVAAINNYGVGDTIFDTTASANVVAQYTRVTAQIDATHYLVSVSQLVGSSGSPVSMMYGSSNRFIAKASSQSKETGWVYAYTAGAANDFIRQTGMNCGNQSTYPGSPQCPVQGQTIH